MAENPFGKNYLKGQLQKDFHAQFSRSQDMYQETMHKIALAFVILLLFYILASLNQESYILSYTMSMKTNYSFIVTNNFYYWISVVTTSLLSMFTVYICQAGYALRRDQCIVRRIRNEYNLHETTFRGYGKNYKGVFFLPDIYLILILFITIVIIAINIWTSYLLRLSFFSVLLLAMPYLLVVLSYCLYFIKYKTRCRPDKIKIESLLDNSDEEI